jgi:hypothetical protein
MGVFGSYLFPFYCTASRVRLQLAARDAPKKTAIGHL